MKAGESWGNGRKTWKCSLEAANRWWRTPSSFPEAVTRGDTSVSSSVCRISVRDSWGLWIKTASVGSVGQRSVVSVRLLWGDALLRRYCAAAAAAAASCLNTSAPSVSAFVSLFLLTTVWQWGEMGLKATVKNCTGCSARRAAGRDWD